MAANTQRTGNGTRKGNTAGNKAPSRNTAGNKAPVKKTPAKKAPAKKTYGNQTQTRGKKAAPKRQAPETAGTLLRDEILLWAVLAAAVLILISNFNLGGSFGKGLSSVIFGLLGVMAYILPFVLFFTTAFIISNKGKKIVWVKMAAVYILMAAVGGLTELTVHGYKAGKAFMDYYDYSAANKSGGGFIGGLMCEGFCPSLGIVGAYVILIILVIICFILITERSLFAGVKKGTSRAYQYAKKDVSMRKEISEAKREQKEIQRDLKKRQELNEVLEKIRAESSGVVVKPREEAAAKKVPKSKRLNKKFTGVSMDTVLQERTEKIDEIHEVIPTVPPTPSMADVDFTIQRNSGRDKAEAGDAERLKPVADGIGEKGLEDVPKQAESIGTQGGDAFGMDGVIQGGEDTDDSIFDVTEEAMPEDAAKEMPEGRRFAWTGIPAGSEEPEEPEAEMPELVMPVLNMPKDAGKVKKAKLSPREEQDAIQSVEEEIVQTAQAVKPEYVFPPITLLKKPKRGKNGDTDRELKETAIKLQTTLHSFGVDVTVINVSCGPSVTRYELMPQQGVKVSRIVNLADDIKLNLAAADIRIEAPIPGKSAVGIEVPNHENSAVMLRELLETEEFKSHPSNLSFAAGKDIAGKVVVTDIAKMPHLLIAGATGSGKSVCINTIVMSILYKAKPEDVKLIMIDPKVVELSVYNGIPHLMIPVVTDPKKAAGALNWGVAEMMDRYKKFADLNVRDLKGYNAKINSVEDIEGDDKPQKLPQIVIIVDELADLMMVSPGEVEDSICRLAQLARAAGIHLIIATQRPSVNVITGLIKANMPSRIAFSVSSGVDSRTIIDMNGAEKLLGKGDMLFYPQGFQKPARVQGAFVSDSEVADVVEFLSQKNSGTDYDKEVEARITKAQSAASDSSAGGGEADSHFADAGKFIIEKDKASIGMLQRVFKIGFNRAARIMDQLAEAGVVGEEEGTKPRKILMSMEEFENYLEEHI